MGKHRVVEIEDLGKPCSYLNPSEANAVFEGEWKKEKQSKSPSLLNACIRSTKPYLWFWSIFFYVLGLVINFFPSMVLKELLLDLEDDILGL